MLNLGTFRVNFCPLISIVGRLSRSQLTQEQVRFYVNKENNWRRNILQKYIQLCTDTKVTVDTALLESNSTAKAILDLIPVLNITYLVMGTKRPPASRYVTATSLLVQLLQAECLCGYKEKKEKRDKHNGQEEGTRALSLCQLILEHLQQPRQSSSKDKMVTQSSVFRSPAASLAPRHAQRGTVASRVLSLSPQNSSTNRFPTLTSQIRLLPASYSGELDLVFRV
ncbi:hypothetical protein RHSIM_Rhsim08G0176600 [Rhododendron simsii]|uniref:Uncharacterized protein n=1 Tax=Rhododendron simsii TaxID=118357 RepID=A0A834LFY7_RHOSS|nr:hypothetical protein RHSIM_Rhsim08G0176600 [Rhododendron simsii]